MYDKRFIANAIERSAETQVDRRRLLTLTGLAGAGAAAAAFLPAASASADTGGVSDGSVLNFALNLEYLEAEFYLRAAYGEGLPDSMTTGTGERGRVSGGHRVPFRSRKIKNFAHEIAKDEKQHVEFLRAALGSARVSQPAIALDAAFTAAAQAAGLIKPGQKFDAFASDNNFLLAAFIFEDVGVTAYKGAAPLITNKTYLGAAAGILAVEAYHAGLIRGALYDEGFETSGIFDAVQKISNARDSLDGKSDDDQGIGNRSYSNIVPTDDNSIAFGRTPGQVLNIVYLNPGRTTKGGFFPKGVNGAITTSA
ncbi:MAG TPA: ferritin-like domain-containing protein [Amnibacterium sp.]|jgi:rubrerythrin|uniref:ferritin-like domain-containing protein n=1 Tax=Amnibacterium sp. TaxID=1872496 RepID=UPI002F950BF6